MRFTSSNTRESSSVTVRSLSMSACWVRKPTVVPFISDTVPSSGCKRPVMIWNIVLFPQPFTPTMPMRAYCGSVRLTSVSTRFMTKDLEILESVKSIIA